MKKKKLYKIKKLILFIFLFLLTLASLSLSWIHQLYGNISVEEILFVLKMPIKGASTNLVGSYLIKALLPSVGIWILIVFLLYFPAGKIYQLIISIEDRSFKINLFPLQWSNPFLCFLCGVWLVGIVCVTDNLFSLKEYVSNQIHQSTFIEEEYVSPNDVAISFPEQKRNLICIFVESCETTNQDYASGGLFSVNYIPELTRIAEENVSFSQSNLIEGAATPPGCTWTVAGLLSETSGVPFKVPGGDNNTMYKYEYFLPGLVSLGDILQEEGYYNCFFAGSDFTFGARRNYFTLHGNYEIFDYPWAKQAGKIPSDYNEWWGYEDEKLFRFAKEKLLELGQSDTPFNVSLLTVDTHQPSGYQCRLCPDLYEEKYGNVWACASAQINDFVNWVKDQDFYENTSIYICGDHCSMNVGFYSADMDDSYTGESKRKVYNAFINPAVEPVKEKNRLFTTMDMFPTILASLGCEIEGERLGLGTNLFSDQQTLSEQYGFEALYTELAKKSNYYNKKLFYP